MLRRDLASMTYHDLRGLLQNIYASLVGLEPYVRENRTGDQPCSGWRRKARAR